MADDIERGDDTEEDSGRSGKKMGLIVALAVLLIGGGIGAAYFFGLFDSGTGQPTEAAASEEQAEAAPALDEHGNPVAAKTVYYAMPEFLVNLSSNTGQTSFIKMSVQLKLPSEQDQLIVTERLPELQNEFNTYLRDLRASDLSGSAGMYRLQEELLARANRILAPEARVDKILFTNILIQ